MNKDQLLSLMRFALTTVGVTVVNKGYTDGETWTALVGGALALVSMIWSWLHHKDSVVIVTNPPTTTL